MSNTVVIHGPHGCGKTRNAQALAAHFGCRRIVDDWNGQSKIEEGSLVLTNHDDWKSSALPAAGSTRMTQPRSVPSIASMSSLPGSAKIGSKPSISRRTRRR